ncbi:DUF6011 domain-containing protein [Streptomyces sp. cg35]|uniref:DUF6011 domain-containing protein n=1 Tax=Streptomyces sp. cg35 TaxID=3421650 RepID=UPI003D18595A
MAFQIQGPLTLQGYDERGRPQFGFSAPAPARPLSAPPPRLPRQEARLLPPLQPQRPAHPKGASSTRPVCTPDGKEPLEGYFTAQFGDSGNDYVTLRFRRQGTNRSFKPGQILVGYLAGPDNQSSYESFASVDSRGRCWIWHAYTGNQRLRQAVASVLGDQRLAGEAWARMSQRCWLCGQPLTTPESLDLLVGPDCKRKKLR